MVVMLTFCDRCSSAAAALIFLFDLSRSGCNAQGRSQSRSANRSLMNLLVCRHTLAQTQLHCRSPEEITYKSTKLCLRSQGISSSVPRQLPNSKLLRACRAHKAFSRFDCISDLHFGFLMSVNLLAQFDRNLKPRMVGV